jgi:hypothetical protein
MSWTADLFQPVLRVTIDRKGQLAVVGPQFESPFNHLKTQLKVEIQKQLLAGGQHRPVPDAGRSRSLLNVPS